MIQESCWISAIVKNSDSTGPDGVSVDPRLPGMVKIKGLCDMYNEMVEIEQLRLFVAVVESKSVHQAASMLGISQPAVSMAIDELEVIYGTSLLKHKTTGVEVTTLGALLHRRGRAVLADLDRMDDEMARLQSEREGTISIALSSTITSTLFSAVGATCRCGAREPPPAMDQTASRSQGLLQDINCDCQQARQNILGDAGKGRALRC
jgi:molybdenum-dependent DNA-binding transcriptional regulator ModE